MSHDPAPKLKGLRRQVRRFRPTRSLVGRIDGRVDRALRQQETLRGSIERQAAQLEKQARLIERLQKTVATMNERARPLELEAKTRMVQHSRISVQVGVLEERLGRLEEQLSTGIVNADDASMAEARSI